MAFDHDAKNLARTCTDLRRYIACNINLTFEFFAAICVAAINHHSRWQLGSFQLLAGLRDAFGLVIGRFAATQNHMAIRVAIGLYDGHLPCLMDRQEVVRSRRGLDRIGRDFNITVRAVLEADRRR